MSHRISLWMAAAALAAGSLGAARSHAGEPKLDDQTRTSVLAALADERRTEAQYHRTLSDLGSVRPFSNAVRAEGRHAAMLEAVLRAHGEDVPAAMAAGGAELASYANLGDACAAAVASEKRNVALYDTAIVPGLPADVARVFEHNRMASLENHLPAFERCAGTAGSGAAAGRGCGRGAGGPRCGHRPQGGAGCGQGCGCR
jgi:hypothetical protein